MADAMEAARQDMEQEAADELVRGERHDLLSLGAAAAVILVPERDLAVLEGEESPVRDGDAVGVSRQIGEHGLRPGERRLGVSQTYQYACRRPAYARGSHP